MSTTKLQYATLDVFTDTRYTGNPLGLVHLLSNIKLSQEQKQTIAREFNYSETVFLHDAADASKNEWTVDIFTKRQELPFAGHPTIGTTCYALSKAAGDTTSGTVSGTFNIKAGRVDLEYDVSTRKARVSIPHNVHIHSKPFSASELKALHPYVPEGTEPPVVSIVNGMTFILVEMSDLEALATVQTTAKGPSKEGLDKEWSDTFLGVYFFTRLPDQSDGIRRVRTRMMSDQALEDPATGSAASALSSYLALIEGQAGQILKIDITQGVEMGRKSDIGVEVRLNSDKQIEEVTLKGGAVQIMKGELTV